MTAVALPYAWYGPVFAWPSMDFDAVADDLATKGMGLLIAMACWPLPQAPNWYEDPEQLTWLYPALLKAMRARGVPVHVDVVNDNKGLGKYHDSKLGLDRYMTQIGSMLDIVFDAGPEGVVLQPVGETRTPAGSALENAVKARFGAAGFRLCWNHGSRPSTAPAGWEFFAYHPAVTLGSAPKGAWIISDHSTPLLWIQDNSLKKPANPARLTQFCRHWAGKGHRVGYFQCWRGEYDVKATAAIAAAFQPA